MFAAGQQCVEFLLLPSSNTYFNYPAAITTYRNRHYTLPLLELRLLLLSILAQTTALSCALTDEVRHA
jgi:hypothetical protein